MNEIYDLSFNYNGNILASCGGDRVIKIFDIANLRPAATIQGAAENIFISIALNYGG
jgi:WD40 repeat protein